jgi:hypothetical protein
MIHADGRTGVVDHWQVACAGNDCLAVPHTPFFEAEHDAAAAWNNRHANKELGTKKSDESDRKSTRLNSSHAILLC